MWIRGRDDDCPTFGTIPPARLSACSEREAAATLDAFTAKYWRKAMTSLKSAAMVSASLIATDFPSSLFIFPSSYFDSSSYFSLLSDDSATASDPRSAIMVAKVLSRAVAEVSLSRMTASTRNGWRRTAFSYSQ